MNDPSHWKTPLKQTPFHARTAAANLLNNRGAWAGYTTSLCYGDEAMEHTAIRNAVSIYDLCPMVKYRITGADAPNYLNRLMVRNPPNGHLVRDPTGIPTGVLHEDAIYRARARLPGISDHTCLQGARGAGPCRQPSCEMRLATLAMAGFALA